MEGTNGLKESEESLVIGFDRVVREKPGSGSIRQLSVSLTKIVSLVEDHSGTALVCQEDQEVGIGPEGVESWRSRVVRLLPEGRDLVKLGWETVDRMWEM